MIDTKSYFEAPISVISESVDDMGYSSLLETYIE